MQFLDAIRIPNKNHSLKRKILTLFCILFFGICLGTFSKFLDYRQSELPAFLQMMDSTLDLHNFLGSFSPWIVIATCIAIYSDTPWCAAIHVLLFFVGMVSSYYIYCNYIAGFFPQAYAMIWIAFTAVSPFLGFLCWYAKGKGGFALILSSGIIGVLINTAFSYGIFYISIRSWLQIIMLLLGIRLLHKSLKETGMILGIGMLFAIIMHNVVPFPIY